jgi:hypothetical protein
MFFCISIGTEYVASDGYDNLQGHFSLFQKSVDNISGLSGLNNWNRKVWTVAHIDIHHVNLSKPHVNLSQPHWRYLTDIYLGDRR